MRNLYNEFFYIPKHGKIREKVMLVRVATTVAVMLLCLILMSVSAYAYFTCDVVSGSNIIKSAHFDVSVAVKNSEGGDVPVLAEGQGRRTVNLSNGTYTVTLKNVGDADTGFCVLSVDPGDLPAYHTQQIGVDVNARTNGQDSITFKITVSQQTKVTFLSHWGTSTYYGYHGDAQNDDSEYICHGEEILISVTPPQASAESGAEGSGNGEESAVSDSTDGESSTDSGSEDASSAADNSVTEGFAGE